MQMKRRGLVYSYCDQNIFDMSVGDRLLLWAMRAWAYSVEHNDCPLRLLLPIFCRTGLVTTTIHFHKAMSSLKLGGANLRPIARLGGDQVRDGEAVLLELWHNVGTGEQEAALQMIERLVDPEWVTNVFEAMVAMWGEALVTRPELFQRPRHSRCHHDNSSPTLTASLMEALRMH